jgi:hypothetical protein
MLVDRRAPTTGDDGAELTCMRAYLNELRALLTTLDDAAVARVAQGDTDSAGGFKRLPGWAAPSGSGMRALFLDRVGRIHLAR